MLLVAALTLQESSRRRVLRALAALTLLLLALSAWGFSRLPGLESEAGALTTGEARFAAALLLPPPLTAAVVVALYLHLWVRVWRPARSRRTPKVG